MPGKDLLTQTIRFFVSMIETGDIWSLGFVIFVLCYGGQFFVASSAKNRQWGLRLGVVVFVLYTGHSVIVKIGIGDAGALSISVLRGFFAGGLTLGLSWIFAGIG